MRSVHRFQIFSHAVDRNLRANCGSDARNQTKISIVAERIGLNASDGALHEIQRKRTLTEEQFVRALGIFDSRPGMIACPKPRRGLERVAVENRLVLD